MKAKLDQRITVQTRGETTTDLNCVTCKRYVDLTNPEGLKWCFEGFVSSQNSLMIKFDRDVKWCYPATIRRQNSG